MNVFLLILRGEPWASFTKVGLNRTIFNFPINFTTCQFNCIIFAKEQRNLSKIIILPSCAEELRTAKQRNDLNKKHCGALKAYTASQVEEQISQISVCLARSPGARRTRSRCGRATACCTCRVMSGHTDKTSVHPAPACSALALCPSSSVTSTTCATLPPVTTTATGCPPRSPSP